MTSENTVLSIDNDREMHCNMISNASFFDITHNEVQYYKHLIDVLMKMHPKRWQLVLHSKKWKFIISFLDTLYPQLGKYKLCTKLYWLFNDMTNFPICQRDGCGKANLKDAGSPFVYPKYCSRYCAAIAEETLEKTRQTCIDKYGVPCTLQTEKSWNAIHQAVMTKYGGTTGNIWETDYGKQRCKTTRHQKYGGKWESDATKEQRKSTIIERYGGTIGNIWSTEHGKNSMKQTMLKRQDMSMQTSLQKKDGISVKFFNQMKSKKKDTIQ